MKKVVLLGGGHANIQVLKILHDKLATRESSPVRLSLISSGEVAFYSGMLPGAVSTQYSDSEIQIPLRPLAYSCNADFYPSTAVAVDPERRRVCLDNGTEVEYDLLAVDIGARSKGTKVAGVEEFAIRTRPLDCFLKAAEEKEREMRQRGKVPTVTVVGGGVAGVELAFSFASRWRVAFAAEIQITIVCAGTELLPGYPATFRTVVLRNLSRYGIQVLYSAEATEVTAEGVQLATGAFLPSDVVVWATGAEPHSVSLNLPLCPSGFLLVNDFLQCPAHPEIFAGGDCITIQSQRSLPKAGVYAVREGPVIAANIIAALSGTALETYQPQSDFLCLVNTGDGRALGGKYGIMFSGVWVWRLKDHIDRSFMTKFSPETLLGPAGVEKYRQGADRREVYACRARLETDYSQQFGCEEGQNQSETERKTASFSPEEAVRTLVDSSDIFAPSSQVEFLLNFQIIKRLGTDESFRTDCASLYQSYFAQRLLA